MAKAIFAPLMPVDTPAQYEPGVAYREVDIFAQEGTDRGFYAGAFDGSTPIGGRKGNRAVASLPVRQALTGGGPFARLRKGR
jgi:hypothetical protein